MSNALFLDNFADAIERTLIVSGLLAFSLNLQTAFYELNGLEDEAVHESTETTSYQALVKCALLSKSYSHHALR